MKFVKIFLLCILGFSGLAAADAENGARTADGSRATVRQQGGSAQVAVVVSQGGEVVKQEAQGAGEQKSPNVAVPSDAAKAEFSPEKISAVKASDAPKKELTEVERLELEHKLYQERLDRGALKSAQSIRGNLRVVVGKVAGVSRQTADVLMFRVFGFALVQFLASALVLLFTYLCVKYVFNFAFEHTLGLACRGGKGGFLPVFVSRIRFPIKTFVWVLAVYFAIVFLISDAESIKITSRAIGIVFWLSVFWVLKIVIDAVFFVITRKLRSKDAKSSANLMDFLRRMIGVLVCLIAVLSVLNNMGVNVNTIIASLGIGGMALAFASQDTIANFFGSVSIIMDRPFIVGDWVKTNSCEGNVEAIGFRSTKIRTFQKTIVTIPNSTLAKEAVENISKMPARKRSFTVGLTYDATAEQIEAVMSRFRTEILEVDGVYNPNGVSVEFVDFGASSLDIEIVYYTARTDAAFYKDVNTRVNLLVMRIVAECKMSFAFPSTSIYIEKNG